MPGIDVSVGEKVSVPAMDELAADICVACFGPLPLDPRHRKLRDIA